MITTPFGAIKIYVDGVAPEYEAAAHIYDRPPVKDHPISGCYRIHVPVEAHSSIHCEVELNNCTICNTGASGEHYVDSEFISGTTILTIGAKDEPPDFDTVRTERGMEYRIHSSAAEAVFGVARIESVL